MTEGAPQPTAAESGPPAQYHAIATLQFGSGVTATMDGLFTIPAGTSREKAYQFVRNHLADAIRRERRLPDDPAVVLFFSMEPNVLP